MWGNSCPGGPVVLGPHIQGDIFTGEGRRREGGEETEGRRMEGGISREGIPEIPSWGGGGKAGGFGGNSLLGRGEYLKFSPDMNFQLHIPCSRV